MALYEGENGARFDIDPESLPPAARARFDESVAAGRLVAVPVVEAKKRTPAKKVAEVTE